MNQFKNKFWKKKSIDIIRFCDEHWKLSFLVSCFSSWKNFVYYDMTIINIEIKTISYIKFSDAEHHQLFSWISMLLMLVGTV